MKQHQQMPFRKGLALIFLSMGLGAVITLLTAWLIGAAPTKHLPGGALSGGFQTSLLLSRFWNLPAWACVVIGTIAGFLGFWLVIDFLP